MPSGHRLRLLRWLIPVTLLLLLALGHSLWLEALGRFLIRSEQPVKSDLIVVLAGDWRGRRVLHAAELVRQGFAPKALVSGPDHHYGLYESELAIALAVRRGYLAGSFIPLPMRGANSTQEEAARIVPELRRRSVRRALVVTSDYHTRRSARIYRAAAPDLDVRLVAAPDAVFRADSWWRHREGRKLVLLEWLKLVTSLFGV